MPDNKLKAFTDYVETAVSATTASRVARSKAKAKKPTYATKQQMINAAQTNKPLMTVADIANQPDFKAALALQAFKPFDKITTIGITFYGPQKTRQARRAALTKKLQKIAQKYNPDATCNDVNVHLNGSDYGCIVLASSYADFLVAVKRVLADLSRKAMEGYN